MDTGEKSFSGAHIWSREGFGPLPVTVLIGLPVCIRGCVYCKSHLSATTWTQARSDSFKSHLNE